MHAVSRQDVNNFPSESWFVLSVAQTQQTDAFYPSLWCTLLGMFSVTYAPFLIRKGVAVFGRPGQAAPRGIGVAWRATR